MNRHDVATKIALRRFLIANGTALDPDTVRDPDMVLDALARDLATALPPGQRDQFLLASGTALNPADARAEADRLSPRAAKARQRANPEVCTYSDGQCASGCRCLPI